MPSVEHAKACDRDRMRLHASVERIRKAQKSPSARQRHRILNACRRIDYQVRVLEEIPTIHGDLPDVGEDDADHRAGLDFA